MKKSLIVGMTTLVFLSGCSTTPSPADIVQQRVDAERVSTEAQKQRDESKTEAIEAQIDATPSWVMNPPNNDALGVYAVGTGVAADPVTAMRKAKLKAEFSLAQAIRQEVSGQERQMEKSYSDNAVSSEYELLVDRFVAAVPLKGHSVIDSDVYALNGKAYAHVLYRISREALHDALAKDVEGKQGDISGQAFAALERRVKGEEE